MRSGQTSPAKRKRAAVLEESEVEDEHEPAADNAAADHDSAFEPAISDGREADATAQPQPEATCLDEGISADADHNPGEGIERDSTENSASPAEAAADPDANASAGMQQDLANSDSKEEVTRQSKPKRKTILDEDSDDED